MKNKHYFPQVSLLICILCCFPHLIHAYSLRQFSNKNGLSNSAILSLYQDHQGVIWIGSCDGLNIFDGTNIHVYNPVNPTKAPLSGNLINDIMETEKDVLWIQTNYGLDRLDTKLQTSKSFTEFKDKNYMAKSRDNDLFIVKDDGYIYYFSVVAVRKDGEITKASKEIPALPILERPTAKPATRVTSNSFVANWEGVEYANTYQVNVYRKHTAKADEAYTLADTDCDVFSSTGTIENPERLSGAFVFGSASGAFDWYISMAAAIDGGIGMDNIYSDIMGNSYMYSQMYDLTGSNGKATFEFTLASPDATTAVVSIAKLLDNNRLQPIESFDIEVTKEMTKHTVEFTKGTDYCCVLVEMRNGSFLIFDDFKLTMDLQAEKSIEIGITNALLQDPNATSAEFTRIDFNNDRISYDVLAAMVYPTLSSPLVSELSNRIEVEDISSVENTENVSASAYVEGGVLYVENPNAEKVEVYNLSGVRIFADNSGAYKVNTNLDANGVYIVRVGDKAIKVVR